MPEQYAETVPYGVRDWYPHMGPEDRAIWERFMEANKDAFDYCQYDVPCGSDPEFDTTVNTATGGDVWRLYQKKIDVVCSRADKLVMVELKKRATAATVGQILQYKKLYIKDYSPTTEPECLILTEAAMADTQEFAESMGVKLIVV